MSDEPAFTKHVAAFGDVQIWFERDREGTTQDIIGAFWRGFDVFEPLQLILTALNSSFEELISNCKDIKDL